MLYYNAFQQNFLVSRVGYTSLRLLIPLFLFVAGTRTHEHALVTDNTEGTAARDAKRVNQKQGQRQTVIDTAMAAGNAAASGAQAARQVLMSRGALAVASKPVTATHRDRHHNVSIVFVGWPTF